MRANGQTQPCRKDHGELSFLRGLLTRYALLRTDDLFACWNLAPALAFWPSIFFMHCLPFSMWRLIFQLLCTHSQLKGWANSLSEFSSLSATFGIHLGQRGWVALMSSSRFKLSTSCDIKVVHQVFIAQCEKFFYPVAAI